MFAASEGQLPEASKLEVVGPVETGHRAVQGEILNRLHLRSLIARCNVGDRFRPRVRHAEVQPLCETALKRSLQPVIVTCSKWREEGGRGAPAEFLIERLTRQTRADNLTGIVVKIPKLPHLARTDIPRLRDEA